MSGAQVNVLAPFRPNGFCKGPLIILPVPWIIPVWLVSPYKIKPFFHNRWKMCLFGPFFAYFSPNGLLFSKSTHQALQFDVRLNFWPWWPHLTHPSWTHHALFFQGMIFRKCDIFACLHLTKPHNQFCLHITSTLGATSLPWSLGPHIPVTLTFIRGQRSPGAKNSLYGCYIPMWYCLHAIGFAKATAAEVYSSQHLSVGCLITFLQCKHRWWRLITRNACPVQY